MTARTISPEYIILWRKTGEQCLDWDSFASICLDEIRSTVANLKSQGVHQYSTYKIEGRIDDLSSEY